MLAGSLSRMEVFSMPRLPSWVRRGMLWALAASLLLHLFLILSPAWRLPALDELFPTDAPMLDAHLVKPPVAHPPERLAPRREQGVQPAMAPVPAAAAPDPAAIQPGAEEPAVPAPEPPAPAAEPEQLSAAVPGIASPLPRRGRIRFAVTRGEGGFIIGQTTHEWQRDDQSYAITSVSETTGLVALFRPARVVQSSAGGFAHGDLLPREFRYERGDGQLETASFDWDRQIVTLSGGRELSIAGGAQDLLSMFYQLTQAAMRGAGFQMAVATGRKLERYDFEWLDEEDIRLKAGNFHAWHVRVRAASGGKDSLEVWLAQEAAGLPVKIRQTDRKGDVFDLLAETVEYEAQ